MSTVSGLSVSVSDDLVEAAREIQDPMRGDRRLERGRVVALAVALDARAT